jgi:hypothetical protein
MDSKDKTTVAEICLYGGNMHGFGYLARTADGRMFGDGEPAPWRSKTDALGLAILDIREKAGIRSGQALVFDPSGEHMAECPIDSIPYYGDLEWKPAPVVTLSYDDIVTMAEKD